MKRILLLAIALTLLALTAGQADYAIVNNSTSSQTAHDSLSIPFFLLDSAGNQVAIADGDSVHLIVWYPGGAVAFQDSGAYNDADITVQTRHGISWYSWQAQVSDLDGTPTEGTYKYHLSIHDKTSAALWTTFTGSFQLYATADFDVTMDEIAATLDTLQNQDDWMAHQSTSDSLYDSLLIVLDSLEALEAWIAHQTELDGLIMFFGACDGCYQILYPRSGTANKDSVIIIDPSLGNDSLVGKVVFYHGTTPSVYDSSYFYIDEPW